MVYFVLRLIISILLKYTVNFLGKILESWSTLCCGHFKINWFIWRSSNKTLNCLYLRLSWYASDPKFPNALGQFSLWLNYQLLQGGACTGGGGGKGWDKRTWCKQESEIECRKCTTVRKYNLCWRVDYFFTSSYLKKTHKFVGLCI